MLTVWLSLIPYHDFASNAESGVRPQRLPRYSERSDPDPDHENTDYW